MSTIYLYNVGDDPKTVHKGVGVVKAALEVDILPDCSLTKPKLKISASNMTISSCNYFYLDDFKRYYYIDEAVLLQHGVYLITGLVDPLKSFEGGINGITALVLRNEFEYNGDIVDDEITPRIKRQFIKKIIGNVGKTVNIVITVAGGDDNT